MATFRDLINRTLVALGHYDDQVDAQASSLTDAYHAKIAQFVNDILEEVEDAGQWRVLRTRDTATISADANSGTLTSSNERSRVFRVADAARREAVPLVFDVTDSANQVRLREMDLSDLLYRDQQTSNASIGSQPSHFALEPTATGMTIYVWPRPTSSRSIEADMIIPQSRLDPDSDLGTTVKVIDTPVVLGTTWWALEDRGEELGPQGQKAEMRYRNELAARVAVEHAAQGLDDLVPV